MDDGAFSKFFRLLMFILLPLGGMVAGILLLAYATAGTIYEYRDTVNPREFLPEVDAIVCLAGGRGRIGRASDIWYGYYRSSISKNNKRRRPARVPALYISGMGPMANWKVLAKQIRPKVLKVLKFDNVVMETESTNTRENARIIKRVAKKRKWKRFLLITSSYHMKRARYALVRDLKGGLKKDVRDQIKVYILSVQQDPFRPQVWKKSFHGIRVTLMEYLKWVYYRVFW